MEAIVAMLALGGLAPFVVLAALLYRGSPGGKVRSLGQRKDNGRDLDTHAVRDRTEAAEAAQKHLERRRRT